MLPDLSTEARQPLNSVSNKGVGIAGAMHKLASEKGARKAKSAAANLLSREAAGVGALISAQGNIDVKMPPILPGMFVVLPSNFGDLLTNRTSHMCLTHITVPASSSLSSAKPPAIARPASRSFDSATSARQRVQTGKRNSVADMPASSGGTAASENVGIKRNFSSVSVDTAGGAITPRSLGGVISASTALTSAAVSATMANWVASNGGKELKRGGEGTTPRGSNGLSGLSEDVINISATAGDQLKAGSMRRGCAGGAGVAGGVGGGVTGTIVSLVGARLGVALSNPLQILERKMSRVSISAMDAVSRDKKRVRFNDDHLEETLKPKEGAAHLPSSYPLDLTASLKAAGTSTFQLLSAVNPITGADMNNTRPGVTWTSGAVPCATCTTSSMNITGTTFAGTVASRAPPPPIPAQSPARPGQVDSSTPRSSGGGGVEGSLAGLSVNVAAVQWSLHQSRTGAVEGGGMGGGGGREKKEGGVGGGHDTHEGQRALPQDFRNLEDYRRAVKHHHPPGPAPKGTQHGRRVLEHSRASGNTTRAPTKSAPHPFQDPSHRVAGGVGTATLRQRPTEPNKNGAGGAVLNVGATSRKPAHCHEKDSLNSMSLNVASGVRGVEFGVASSGGKSALYDIKNFGFVGPTTSNGVPTSRADTRAKGEGGGVQTSRVMARSGARVTSQSHTSQSQAQTSQSHSSRDQTAPANSQPPQQQQCGGGQGSSNMAGIFSMGLPFGGFEVPSAQADKPPTLAR